jgi:hypothetical protein
VNTKNPINPNNTDPPSNDESSTAMSWVIVVGIALSFFLWGIFVFFVVGVSWPPPWRYGTVADVPGQSVYGVRGAEKAAGTAPLEEGKVRRQHVMGRGEKTGRPGDKGGS